MQLRIFCFFTQFIILCILQGPVPIKAIIGTNVGIVDLNEFPSLVCLTTLEPNRAVGETCFCSATLITSNHIITTETCVYEIGLNVIQAIVTTADLSMGICTYPVWWISFDQWVQTFNQPRPSEFNNIAVLRILGANPPSNLPTILAINPIHLLEGLHAEVYACRPFQPDVQQPMLHKVSVRVLRHSYCESIVSNLLGGQLAISENHVCSLGQPYAYLEKHDTGGPVVFFYGIVAINVGLYPYSNDIPMENKVNLHLALASYTQFIENMSAQ